MRVFMLLDGASKFETCLSSHSALPAVHCTSGLPRNARAPRFGPTCTVGRTEVPAFHLGRGASPPDSTDMLGHVLPPTELFEPATGRRCLTVVGSRHRFRLPPVAGRGPAMRCLDDISPLRGFGMLTRPTSRIPDSHVHAVRAVGARAPFCSQGQTCCDLSLPPRFPCPFFRMNACKPGCHCNANRP